MRRPFVKEKLRIPGAQRYAEMALERIARIEEKRLLAQVRGESPICWRPGNGRSQPLVTVRVATRGNLDDLLNRSLPSIIRQTYPHLDILVVGDGCTDEVSTAIKSVGESRLRYVNLPHGGIYPSTPWNRWRVAGATPMNVALDLAAGEFLAPCDDDDEFTDDHVEVLLRSITAQSAEFVYSRALCIDEDGSRSIIGSSPLRQGAITHGSVLYRAELRFFRHSTTSWRMAEPSDWNLWRRMRAAGVSMAFCNQVTYRYFRRARPVA